MSWVGLASCERARARPSTMDPSEAAKSRSEVWEVAPLASDIVDSCGESSDMAEMDDVRGREDTERRESDAVVEKKAY